MNGLLGQVNRIAVLCDPAPSPSARRDVAQRARTRVLEVELTCSDATEHRRRVEDRLQSGGGQGGPTWQDVLERDYRPWVTADHVIDTAMATEAQAAASLRAMVLGPE